MGTEQAAGGQQSNEELLPLQELSDGSVQVGSSLDAGADPRANDDDDDDDRPVTGGAGTIAEQAELAQAKTEEEREAIRVRRRQERHDKRQRAREREDALRAQLQRAERANQELNERLGLIERKTSGSELAQLDNAISQAEQAYTAFKDQVSDAITRQDGAAAAQATERMVVARERHRELSHIRQQYTSAPQRAAPPLDPQLVRHAQEWSARNSWYDPNAKDVDSRLALALDKSVVDDGFSPTSAEYWAELDRRIAKYLPHRASSGSRSDSGGILPATDPARARPSRTVVTGSGRESAAAASGAGTYNLSPERVQAMKDAGMWNDPVKRDEMIRYYRDHDRRAGSSKS